MYDRRTEVCVPIARIIVSSLQPDCVRGWREDGLSYCLGFKSLVASQRLVLNIGISMIEPFQSRILLNYRVLGLIIFGGCRKHCLTSWSLPTSALRSRTGRAIPHSLVFGTLSAR